MARRLPFGKGIFGVLMAQQQWFELRLADLAHVVAFWACTIGLGAILIAW
jgi:hypothetical protein